MHLLECLLFFLSALARKIERKDSHDRYSKNRSGYRTDREISNIHAANLNRLGFFILASLFQFHQHLPRDFLESLKHARTLECDRFDDRFILAAKFFF